MNLNDTLLFGVDTTTIFITMVFVILIILAAMMVLQSKILRVLSKQDKEVDEVKVSKPEVEVKHQEVLKAPSKTGLTKGETKLVGIEDDEHAAVIMAVVSNAANIPLTSLKIKSIKRIDNILKTN
ncbi:MAG: Oxaloacetate decarboxylase, gamma chain [Clostridiales bacterium]|jgi:oxaloacetate decarboxylase gamma subunit|nr:Oxaloacetate decarboxylase, gamma chain [Clostridiales bacterium]